MRSRKICFIFQFSKGQAAVAILEFPIEHATPTFLNSFYPLKLRISAL